MRVRFKFFVLLLPFFFSGYLFGQKKEINRYKDSVETLLDSIHALSQNVEKFKKEIASEKKQSQKLNEEWEACKSALRALPNPLSTLTPTLIVDQFWATRNLNEKEVRELIPGILLADSNTQWQQYAKDNTPAYCFHRYDSAKVNGVLLNIPALLVLDKQLQTKGNGWHFPQHSDIRKLEKNLNNKISPLLALSGRPSSVKGWKKPGWDLFGMNLIPLSFRLNDRIQWYADGSATFYCQDTTDILLKKNLSLFELNEELPNSILITSNDLADEYAYFGVYVRLIKY